MTSIQRTLVFLVAAVLSAGVAGFTHWSSRPKEVDWSQGIGEEFFPEFRDPGKATSLSVAVFDKKAAKTGTFSVEFKDGTWRIPSHNNYPADGKDRLKTTAASVIGITRGSLAGRTKEAHKEHNLLDPLDESAGDTEGRGQRITLKDKDKVLVDYVIGNKKAGPGNTYYVRRADEERFYLSELKIELSTKFGDWIEPDLLDLRRDDVKAIVLDRYSVDIVQKKFADGPKSLIERDSATEDWTIADLDTTSQKPKTSVINSMLTAFDDLKIVGVRKKPEGLSASLSESDTLKVTQSDLDSLAARGYYFIPGKGLLSNEGELIVSTFNGVTYILRFGSVFTGSDVEVEIGSEKEAATASPPKADNPQGEPAEGVKKNRFVFITAQFNPEVIGEAPVEPVKPEPLKEDATAVPEADKPADGEKPAEGPKTDPKAAYDKALEEYNFQMSVFKIKKQEYDEKVAEGEKKAKRLNARFADWYYVISEDLFEDLRVKPEDLEEPNTPAPGEPLPELPNLPKLPMKAEPQGGKAATPETPAEPAKPAEGAPVEAEKPAEGSPPADGAKPAEPPAPAEEKPAPPAEPKSE
ncbi:MAG: DUF4340 domain-containing protein [Planctomycetota bacterium]|nr:MAG: DUF4340 domain-containing protein [Planctomycetota bacterium]